MSLDSSDPIDQAFADAPQEPAFSGDPIDAAFNSKNEKPTHDPSLAERYVGFQESQLHGLTGGAGAMLGGLTYAGGKLGQLLGSKETEEQLQKDREDAASSITYQPRTSEGKRQAANMDSAAQYLGPKEGQAAGDYVMDKTGSPALATAANVGANIPQFLLGKAFDVKGSPAAPMTADEVAANVAAKQSGGAAGAAANLQSVTPEMKSAIVDAARKTGGAVNPEAYARHLEADTLPVPMRLTKGQALQDPGILSQEMNMRGANPELRERFTEQNQNLIDNLDEIRRTAAPDAVGNDHIQNGQALLDKYKAYDAPIKAQVSANYKALADANGGDLPVDGVSFADAADAALKKNMKAPFLPSGVRTILNNVRDEGQMSYENFENLRTTLSAEARKADRAGDGNSAAAVNMTRNALEQLPMSQASAPIKALADKARQSAAARFNEIDADPAYKASVNDDTPPGEQSPLADDFVKKYVIGGKKANLDLMKQKFASDPEATGTIQASALNYLKSKAGIDPYTNTGNFSQSGYNKARAELEPRMDSLLDPDTADQVRKLGNVARYTQAQPRGSYVNNSNTFVSALGAKTGTLLERAANTAVPYVNLGTAAKEALAKRAQSLSVHESLKPGAGLDVLNEK